MKNETNNPKNVDVKDSNYKNQLKIIFRYLQDNIATASMIADATGIPHKNICRYKRDLEKAGRLWEMVEKQCKIIGFLAWYLTTNPNNTPLNNQLELF
tara:strand:- start:542 stop:835 length:294 start_codon:yes stop_codon:yes gene_type:complete